MDIIRYFKLKKRMTNGCKLCNNCPLSTQNNNLNQFCIDFEFEYPEKAVEIVEKWAEEHPAKTRQSEFLKMFPNAPMDSYGIVTNCPLEMDETFEADCTITCDKCCRSYWLAEIEEEE